MSRTHAPDHEAAIAGAASRSGPGTGRTLDGARRVAAGGPREFVVGTGGRSLYRFEHDPLPSTEARHEGQRLTARGDD